MLEPNPSFAHDLIDIDLGVELLAIENYRTGLVWTLMDSFYTTSRTRRAAGFHLTGTEPAHRSDANTRGMPVSWDRSENNYYCASRPTIFIPTQIFKNFACLRELCSFRRQIPINFMSTVHYSSKTFVQAAGIAEQIEQLEEQLNALLQGENSVVVKPRAPKAAPKRRVSAPKKAEKAEAAAPKAAEEGRGTLRPAVVSILEKSKNPLKTADIYDALVAQGS